MKTAVSVNIESYSEDQRVQQQVDGDLYQKGDHYYLRYEESDPEMSGTMTTIKLERERIRLLRSGNVRSELTFVQGQSCRGVYEMPQGTLQMHTLTNSLIMELTGGLGTVDWSYDLYVLGEKSGSFRLKVTISTRQQPQ
ncbi:DUF1934 domain-containing protein [Paenibacillus sp. UNC451MF]|uniref:DUF1934 domain-containing protein n=1 Tax=Paenibacillus sp. UNC451MF TaxID=1449063 RepID=UPI00055FFB9C|nr:DUF1934 domain-containing protein [Paenibacillus sp. UNC451MF]